MNKPVILTLIGLAIYAAAVMLYLNAHTPFEVPEAFRGGPGDPSMFMEREHVQTVHHYAKERWLAALLPIPLEWIVYILLMTSGVSLWFQHKAKQISAKPFLQTGVYVFLLSVVMGLVSLPADVYLFKLAQSYEMTEMTSMEWVSLQLKQFALSFLMWLPVIWGLYTLLKKVHRRRWWLWSWLATIPLTLFLLFIQPVVIDPMFHTYEPLQHAELKKDIELLGGQAGIPADRIFQVNMSEQTNALNAYVNGIGGSARIVLWDTLIKALSVDETTFVTAHEIGHYINHDIWRAFAFTIIVAFFAYRLIFHYYFRMLLRWGRKWKIRTSADLAALPMLLLVVSIVSFTLTPIHNAYSRHLERQADEVAAQLQHPEAGIRALQKLAIHSKAEVNPPLILHFWFDSHPRLVERIADLQEKLP
ncbi:M48 family metallopeptidase [Paenibacillus turpanensis]|uniref:M48 family metallopeptidase n=1 Tax=Paenibacillus turpanensis TaxID=2689078 RepID=UPI00140C0C71|nr:M48 family metallopeptidase [Paenibacillus turpanensis]